MAPSGGRGLPRLGKRARQVLDALFRLREASASELLQAVDDLPSYSATRSVLRVLLERGLVKRREEGFRYLYSPALPRRAASRSALRHLLETFFDGSPAKTMQALVDLSREEGEKVDWEELERQVQRAREEGR